MGIFDRFNSVLKSNLNSMVDKAEDPGKLLDQTVIDMEAFAIAKVCALEGVPFCSLKYVTDGSDSNASSDWAANLPRAAARFREAFDRLTR